MPSKKLPVVLLLTFIGLKVSAQSIIIKGKVTSGSLPLEFVTVLIKGTNNGTTTSKDGGYLLKCAKKDSCELFISLIGYKTRNVEIHPNANVTILNIALQKEPSELNEVVVTGVSRAELIRESPLAAVSVSPKEIDEASADNVIDAVAKNAPGFETVKTGPNVSKPFINGLGYNRVLTLYDGLRVETQQWGDEHGVPEDDYLIERAEVIKGPASLMYGSDAIAGVLSLFPAVPDDTDKIVHGRYLSEYQTNNGLAGNALRLSFANPHWAWQLSGAERIARNYTDPIDGRVYNTGFKMVNAAGLVGYHNDKGYSHLTFTIYDNRQGIPDGSRDSLSRKFTYQIYESPGENTIQPRVDNIKDRPIVPGDTLNSYALSPLSQRIQDYRLYTDNFYKLGQGDIKALLGFEQNIRREFDHPTDPKQAGEYILLNTIDYSMRYNAPRVLNIQPSFGVNGMYQNNTNRNATDFPIPDYNLFDAGGYGFVKWKHKKWTLAGGIRYDHRSENGDAMYIKPNPVTGFYEQTGRADTSGTKQFPVFKVNFAGITGSLGTTYNFSEQLSFKANIARGYRAPNITELASNGLDPGAHIVYEGNLKAVPEFSLQEDMGLAGALNNLSFDLSVFNNHIQNFMYEDQEVDANGNPVVIVPGNKTYQFQQTNARLYGINATLDIHPQSLPGFSFGNVFTAVYGFNLNPKYANAGSQGEYLPFIPPPEWQGAVSYTTRRYHKIIRSVTIKAESDYSAAQNRYLGLNNTETPTASYLLFNTGVHADVSYGQTHTLQVELQVNNIFNTAYQSHLSRLQYFEYYTASPNGRLGIYNMGRNICMKVIMAF